MPAFSELAKDLIERILVVDPTKRITIPEMKRHLYFRSNLPCDYIVPKPLPLPAFGQPIDLNEVPPDIVDIIHKVGYTNDEELANDFSQPGHSMAKVFYYMLTSRVALDQIDWTQSVGNDEPVDENEETYMMAPFNQAFGVGGNDPFHRHQNDIGQSLELGMSIANRPDWVVQETEAVEFMQTHDIICQGMDVALTMDSIQILCRNMDMQWFHPDDFMIVARREKQELYIVFQCMSNGIDQTETRVQLQLCHGKMESFNYVCRCAEDIIASMQGQIR